MFAVSLAGYNLNDQTKMPFNVSFVAREKISSINAPDRLVPLEQCTIDHWDVNT